MKIQEHYSLQALNTFGLRVRARYYCRIATLGGLRSVLDWQQVHPDLPVLFLGGGSNVLFLQDYPGLVVQVQLREREVLGSDSDHVYVRAGAGENWHEWVRWTIAQGYAGLENLSLIPGTVGAAPMQNIGAYGVELKDCFYELQALDWRSAELREFSLAECQFGYRDSYFKSVEPERWLIASVVFRLPRRPDWLIDYAGVREQVAGKPLSAEVISDAIIQLRRSKLPDPTQLGNAGSFFKNPLISATHWGGLKEQFPTMPAWVQTDRQVKISAAWLIEQCGWKGYQQHGVGVYQHHALILVNYGNGTGMALWQLAKAIIHSVQDKFAIHLEPEPRVITV